MKTTSAKFRNVSSNLYSVPHAPGCVRVQVESVRVREDQRGKGVGEKMFQWAFQHAKAKGAHMLQLTSDKKRPDAIRFYEKLGFTGSHEGMKKII